MIHFPVLRTKRLTVQLQELTMLQSIELAAVPEHANEEATERFLRAAIKESTGAVIDPADWTVQERTMAVAHYMASTMDDGPDFALDRAGKVRYSDYLIADQDYQGASVPVGDIEGDSWAAHHLTGRLAGAIERISGEIKGIEHGTHWIIGRMAAQLVPNAEALPTDGDIDAALIQRMKIILSYPESVFVQLQEGFYRASAGLEHLFLFSTDSDGLLIQPREAGADKPPARFPARACITPLALGLGGKPQTARS